MKNMIRLLFGPTVAFFLILSGCKGPAGPEGPIGPIGATGAAGAAGVAGPAGSANVVYSSWFTLPANSSLWVSQSFQGYPAHRYQITPAASITQTNIDKGVIIIYADLAFSGGGIVQLPHRDKFGTTDDYFFGLPIAGLINLWCVHYGSAVVATTYQTRFRYVVIPGVVSGGRVDSPVDLSDYYAVKAYYKIPD